jgi:Flp pilus assembly pilin Flp
MTTVIRLLRSLWTQDSGQDVIDYALLAALLGVCVATAMTELPHHHRHHESHMGVWYGRHHAHPAQTATPAILSSVLSSDRPDRIDQ